MNVYETRGSRSTVPGPGPPPGSAVGLGQVKPGTVGEPKKGFRPPQHCPTLAQVVSRKVQAAVPEEGLVRFYNPMVLHNHRSSHRCSLLLYEILGCSLLRMVHYNIINNLNDKTSIF